MSERDYESYNILGEALEADSKEDTQTTELMTVSTSLQTIPNAEEAKETDEEIHAFYQEATYEPESNTYEETTHFEEPIKETEKTQKEKEPKKEKFKIKMPQFKGFNANSQFKKFNQDKKRSTWQKVLMILGALALLILLSPFILCVIAAALTFVGGILTAIFGSMLAGAFVLGTTCFAATQLTSLMVIAGVALGICGISFGLILLLLSIMLLKWIVKRMRRNTAKKRGI